MKLNEIKLFFENYILKYKLQITLSNKTLNNNFQITIPNNKFK